MKKDVKKIKNTKASSVPKDANSKTAKHKRVILMALCACFLVSALLLTCYFLIPKSSKSAEDPYIYYPVNYAEDIFANKAYMEKNRDLFFGDYNEQQLYQYETDYEKASDECKFFLDYFKCVIYGEYENYPDFFVKGYFDDKEQPKFTMQMIYDIDVRLHDTAVLEIDGQSTEVYHYRVDYRIFRNNGTFRYGVSSNVKDTQFYQLIKSEDGPYLIRQILEVEDAQ